MFFTEIAEPEEPPKEEDEKEETTDDDDDDDDDDDADTPRKPDISVVSVLERIRNSAGDQEEPDPETEETVLVSDLALTWTSKSEQFRAKLESMPPNRRHECFPRTPYYFTVWRVSKKPLKLNHFIV